MGGPQRVLIVDKGKIHATKFGVAKHTMISFLLKHGCQIATQSLSLTVVVPKMC